MLDKLTKVLSTANPVFAIAILQHPCDVAKEKQKGDEDENANCEKN